MYKNLNIRPGQAQDMAELHAMIGELALYERAPEEVSNSPQQLLNDWQEHRAFDFLIAELNGEIVGMALYYPRYSTWKGRCYYLEDLYVREAYRGQGAGMALLNAVAEEARKAGALRLDWQVLDWNAPAVQFYENIGAIIEKQWWNGKWWV